MKKLLSLFFAVLIISLTLCPAFAADGELKGKAQIRAVYSVKEGEKWVETGVAPKGEIVKADIFVTTDFLLGNYSFLFYYTKDTLSPVKQNGEALEEYNDFSASFSGGFYSADSEEMLETLKDKSIMTRADTEKYGIIHVFGETGTVKQPSGKENLVSLYFKVTGNEGEEGEILLSPNTKQTDPQIVLTNLDFVTNTDCLNKAYCEVTKDDYKNVMNYSLSIANTGSALAIQNEYKEAFYLEKNADTIYKEYKVNFGAALEIPAEPAKIGYTFIGWKRVSDDSLVNIENEKMDSVNGKSYYASWKANTYSVTFMAQGALVAKIQYTYGQKSVALPEIPQKAGYTGVWPAYSLGAGDFTIEAIYTCNIVNFEIKNKPANDGAKQVNYRSYIKLTAQCENISEDCRIAWFEGSSKTPFAIGQAGENAFSFTTKPSKISIFKKTGQLRNDTTYTAKVIDANGNVVSDENGEEFSISENITVNKGFFKKLVAFFKALFKKLPTVDQ